ncbi:MAG: fructosamine kinase family protein [Gammaproteobacteria bacterium]|nr:fructosamine kinase family protein [Gammaproteobacteria bacterium]
MWYALSQEISATTNSTFKLRHRLSVGGGCINSAFAIEGEDGRKYFVKLNDASKVGMFVAEAAGLRKIGQTQTIHAPEPVCWGTVGDAAYFVQEYLGLRGSNSPANMEKLGNKIAQMHRVTASTGQYGWHINNTIGSTPQINTHADNWPAFWRKRRLGAQLQLAARDGYGGALQRKGERLLGDIPAFFTAYTPTPSLLHGDLWSGNYGILACGDPVIFDPAVYYGDRETDMAMTELFGGFSTAFYHAYNDAYPLDSGYQTRKTLYNLYHILNHLNLFGGAYLPQTERMMDALLSEIR